MARARSRPRLSVRHRSALCTKLSIVAAFAILFQALRLPADNVPVRHQEGLMHGFLVVKTLDGKVLADGQLTQDAQGDKVTAHLIFRFKDNSLYEETTQFSQRGTF